MKPLLALALASIAVPALAAPQAATPVQNSMRRFPGVSDSGNAIISEGLNRPDPQLDGLGGKARTLHDQMAAAVSAPNVDVERVAALLRQYDALQAQGRQRFTERTIATMRQLSAADRSAFLRDLLMAQPGGSQR